MIWHVLAGRVAGAVGRRVRIVRQGGRISEARHSWCMRGWRVAFPSELFYYDANNMRLSRESMVLALHEKRRAKHT